VRGFFKILITRLKAIIIKKFSIHFTEYILLLTEKLTGIRHCGEFGTADSIPGPDPTHLLAIVNKNNFYNPTLLIKINSHKGKYVNATDDQSEEIYACKSYNFQCVNVIF
jgi:hypothetical protein